MRLTNIDAVSEIVRFKCGKWEGLANTIIKEFYALKPVDAVPVRHGRWIKKRYWSDWYGMGESYGYWYKCSECGGEVKGGYESCDNKFCRNCGADMWKDGDDGKTD